LEVNLAGKGTTNVIEGYRNWRSTKQVKEQWRALRAAEAQGVNLTKKVES
jgi:hypothetical protein